jgi:hypothetical protein
MRLAGFEPGTLRTRGHRTHHSVNPAFIECAPKIQYDRAALKESEVTNFPDSLL